MKSNESKKTYVFIYFPRLSCVGIVADLGLEFWHWKEQPEKRGMGTGGQAGQGQGNAV